MNSRVLKRVCDDKRKLLRDDGETSEAFEAPFVSFGISACNYPHEYDLFTCCRLFHVN